MNETVFLLLGSNLGDRGALLDEAARRLTGTPGLTLTAASSTYASSPAECPPGSPDFLNRVLKMECSLSPLGLLDITQKIETDLGRTGKGTNAPRPIDIDIILFGDRILRTERLEIPHPRMKRRPFVLVPLAEVAPEAVDPATRRPFADFIPPESLQDVVKCEEPVHDR
ncbi:MAG: 2-amino-4-hydroxy-6-hydroxymethyldihydropteridine diphosphokinase [candidate division Zixibacteria bacterium]|nr:2-amino-4-hydroxy-6-hydroxymethyldihydropteridine diphosphokinase [candidate division Zixibacteria bacterium]